MDSIYESPIDFPFPPQNAVTMNWKNYFKHINNIKEEITSKETRNECYDGILFCAN